MSKDKFSSASKRTGRVENKRKTADTDEARLRRLEDRARQLEDERDLMQTMYQYAHCLDYGIEDGFADCWAEDATWERFWRNESTMRSEGLVQILRVFREHTHAPERFHKHVVVEPRIKITGDRAEVESYFIRFDENPDGPYVYAFGRYQDVLMRCEDGRWRFQHRRIVSEAHLAKP